jgi:hypothetical protein
MRALLAAAVTMTAALAGPGPAQAAAETDLSQAFQIKVAEGVPLKLTSLKALGTPQRGTNAGNTTCYVESPFGPQLALGGSEMQAAFTMRCQDNTTGFPSAETSLAYLNGEIRRTNGAFYSASFENAGANAATVVVVAAPATGSFRGHVLAYVILLNVPYAAEFDTVRTLDIV